MAYVVQDRDDRLSSLRALWDAVDDPFDRYGRLVMTARAAARVAPADKTAEADAIVASMLTAGFDRAALRWQPHVARGTLAWAMLALADPSPRARISYSDRSEEHTSELQSLMRISYAVLCMKKTQDCSYFYYTD